MSGIKIGGDIGAAFEEQKRRLKKTNIKDVLVGGVSGALLSRATGLAGDKGIGQTVVEGVEKLGQGLGKALGGLGGGGGAGKADTGSLTGLEEKRTTLGEEAAAAEAKRGERIAPQLSAAAQIDRGGVQDVGGITEVTTDPTPGQAFLAQQEALATQLAATAAGQGPSIAALQAQESGEQALAQQLALAAGATGPGAALTRRTGQQQAATLGQAITRQAVTGRLAEAKQAQDLLANVVSSGRTEAQRDAARQFQADQVNTEVALKSALANQNIDLEVLKTNAASLDQTALANLEAQLKQQGLDDAATANYFKFQLGLSDLDLSSALKKIGYDEQRASNAQQRSDQLFGSILTAGGAIAGGIFGGPGGAVAGAKLGSTIAG